MNLIQMVEYENLKKFNQAFEPEFKQKFNDFLNNGWYILGKEVASFEEEFARYNQVENVVGVSNGLEALSMSLKSLHLNAGSEVIVPSNTFIATILAILHCDMVPVLAETEINSYKIDPHKIQEAITPKTAVIMIVHLYGQCCQMDLIMDIVNENNLVLIEDSAQAHGAMFNGKKAGTFGDFGAFSFYPTKNLGALGDGGAVIVKCDEHKNRLRQLRNYGSGEKYHNDVIGYNARLDELQAAFLRIKLPYLDQINNHKRTLANIYLDNLSDRYILPMQAEEQHHVYHVFNIRHQKRDELKEYLTRNNIGTVIHYPVAPHKQVALKGILPATGFPIAEEIHATTLSLPCSYFHTEDEIYKTVDILNRFN